MQLHTCVTATQIKAQIILEPYRNVQNTLTFQCQISGQFGMLSCLNGSCQWVIPISIFSLFCLLLLYLYSIHKQNRSLSLKKKTHELLLHVLLIYVCGSVYYGMHTEVRAKIGESVSSFQLFMSSRDQTQVSRPVWDASVPTESSHQLIFYRDCHYFSS